MAGQGGGGAFVLFYFIFLIILGLPIMCMEFAVGRASQKSPVKAYQALEKPGSKWHIHGYFTLIGCYLLMMFYTTVAGWMLHYFYLTASGKFEGADADSVSGAFSEMLSSPGIMKFWMVLVVLIGIFVCIKGLQSGLEHITKVMMIALLAIMVVLAVNSFFMPGAKERLSFYLLPDFNRMQELGVMNTLVGAMNQAFFHTEPRCRRNGYFRKLHRQRPLTSRRIGKSRTPRHIRCDNSRPYNIPGLLYIQCRPDIRPKPYIHHSA